MQGTQEIAIRSCNKTIRLTKDKQSRIVSSSLLMLLENEIRHEVH